MGKTSWLTPSTGVKMHKEYMCNLLLFLMPKYARFHRVMTSIVRGFFVEHKRGMRRSLLRHKGRCSPSEHCNCWLKPNRFTRGV